MNPSELPLDPTPLIPARRKVAIVGTGLVGSAIANALALRESCDTLILIDKDGAKAAGQALDIADVATSGQKLSVSSGDYAALGGAQVVVLAPGLRLTEEQSRAYALERNTHTFREVVLGVQRHAPEAVLIVASQPVDALTQLSAELLGPERQHQVFGVGTALETLELRAALARRLRLHPRHIHGHVLGEEGTAALVAWSGVNIAGVPLKAHCEARQIPWNNLDREEITDQVRRSSLRAARGKGGVSFGVGATVARLVEAVLADSGEIFTVSAPSARYGVALSLPRILGRGGVQETLELPLDPTEQQALERLARDLRSQLAHRSAEA